MKFKLLLLSLLCCALDAFAGSNKDTVIVRRSMNASRIETAPKIDGVLDDDCWKNAEVTGNFIQNSPVERAAAAFPTEVRITYDNTAIYIGAMCYDTSPDSIKRQLGLRDDYLNADNFRIVFDTYNTQQDAFDFSVTASGVQSD
ncbi:MAG TPA: carbohydrate binding family 9 domain-containing protein, partial [Bacteroidia bacterium]|nr:carbohydrate binding family 9 domain-containing protein [Bacteroidia bacterium]